MDEYTNVNAPFPMPDALQEFSVETSNYNAEYGQNAGGVRFYRLLQTRMAGRSPCSSNRNRGGSETST